MTERMKGGPLSIELELLLLPIGEPLLEQVGAPLLVFAWQVLKHALPALLPHRCNPLQKSEFQKHRVDGYNAFRSVSL